MFAISFQKQILVQVTGWPKVTTSDKWEITSVTNLAIFLRYSGNPEDGWAVMAKYNPAVLLWNQCRHRMVWIGRNLKDYNPYYHYHDHHIIAMVSMRLWVRRTSLRNTCSGIIKWYSSAPLKCDFLISMKILNEEPDPHVLNSSSCLTHLTAFPTSAIPEENYHTFLPHSQIFHKVMQALFGIWGGTGIARQDLSPFQKVVPTR